MSFLDAHIAEAGGWRRLKDQVLVSIAPPVIATPKPIFGCSTGPPSSVNLANSDLLTQYQGMNREQMFYELQSEMATATDPLPMKLFHGYTDGPVPTNFMNTEVAWAHTAGYAVCHNMHADDVALSSGGQNANIQAYCNSVPSDAVVYAVINHEPSNDGYTDAQGVFVSTYNPTQWRAGVAKFAERIIAYRGTKKIIPTICVINWDISSKNVAGASKYWEQNPAPEMLALGVNLDHVVYTTDGYDTEPVTIGGALNLFRSTSARARSWGFKRFALSEVQAKSWLTADRNVYAAWAQELNDFAIEEKFEYVAWFISGVGKRAGNEGWFIYGSANKTQVGALAAAGSTRAVATQ